MPFWRWTHFHRSMATTRGEKISYGKTYLNASDWLSNLVYGNSPSRDLITIKLVIIIIRVANHHYHISEKNGEFHRKLLLFLVAFSVSKRRSYDESRHFILLALHIKVVFSALSKCNEFHITWNWFDLRDKKKCNIGMNKNCMAQWIIVKCRICCDCQFQSEGLCIWVREMIQAFFFFI